MDLRSVKWFLQEVGTRSGTWNLRAHDIKPLCANLARVLEKAGNRRHFPKAVSPTAIGIPLAPIRPQDKATAKEIDGVTSSLQDAFREDSEGVRWCIDYLKNNTSQTKSGTRFTQTEDIIKFAKLIEKVIPRSRWEHKYYACAQGCRRGAECLEIIGSKLQSEGCESREID